MLGVCEVGRWGEGVLGRANSLAKACAWSAGLARAWDQVGDRESWRWAGPQVPTGGRQASLEEGVGQ